ncbi:hypothetical protein [Lentiprolixibacter aurantiacus]|uniref:Uncharacterized protein n=1 Tax=Lentiprolixibacter aurantiacus TaxID=2993939 RepID=A0AAE3MLQ0_9FLAO|nr:hypothetical protein [Lentiprolixibacter aurantiacus]MCX2719728.1 hypothetical protein [Lentiprolixibacter aurantiacus]
MKTLKILLAGFVVSCFCLTTNVYSQEKWGNSGKWEETHRFICPCSGEYLEGTLVFQMNAKGKVGLVTIKGHLIGVDEYGTPSGDRYIFNRVDHWNAETAQESIRVRTVRKKDGLVTNFTIFYQDGEVSSRCF